MTENEKLKLVKTLSGETDTDTLLAFLTLAGERICRKAYPFDATVHQVPEQYEMVQVEITCYLLNKRGAEGETVHNENGINRTYESASIPDSMLKQVTPFVGVG